MLTRTFQVIVLTSIAAILLQTGPGSLHAQNGASAALTGQITSTEEGAMEGVLISAKRGVLLLQSR